MTLIAAFRCEEGAVLCADQQETVGGVRVTVNKLRPQECGHYTLAAAGSGNGDLIEGFIESYARAVKDWPAGLDEAMARQASREFLLDFHANEVSVYPGDADSKLNHFLICIKPVNSPDIFLWEFRGSVVVSVKDYTLIGIGEAIYKHELKKLYRGKPRGLQAVLLGVHLFSMAKQTSNYVGGPTDIIFVSGSGMSVEEVGAVNVLEESVTRFNERIAELVLACPDTSVWDSELEALLKKFHDEVMKMREKFAKTYQVGALIRTFVDPNYTGDPYPKFPSGSIVMLDPDAKPYSEVILTRNNPLSDESIPSLESESEPESPPSDSQTSEGQT